MLKGSRRRQGQKCCKQLGFRNRWARHDGSSEMGYAAVCIRSRIPMNAVPNGARTMSVDYNVGMTERSPNVCTGYRLPFPLSSELAQASGRSDYTLIESPGSQVILGKDKLIEHRRIVAEQQEEKEAQCVCHD